MNYHREFVQKNIVVLRSLESSNSKEISEFSNSSSEFEQKPLEKSLRISETSKIRYSNSSQLHRRILRKKAIENKIKETELSRNSSVSNSMLESSNNSQSFILSHAFEKDKVMKYSMQRFDIYIY